MANPDVPFVEASRHGTEFNPSVPVWTWPHGYYRQRADLWNRPLQALVARGIWPQIHAAGMPDIEYHTTIWYNRAEDLPEVLRLQGRPAWVDFGPAWRFAQVAQGVYMRVHAPAAGELVVRPVDAEAATGQLVVRGAVSAAGQGARVRIEQDGRVLAQSTWTTSSLNELVVNNLEIPPEGIRLQLVAEPTSQVQALLIADAGILPVR